MPNLLFNTLPENHPRKGDQQFVRSLAILGAFALILAAFACFGTPASAETAGRDIIRCMPKSVCLPEIQGTTTIIYEAPNVIERADSILAKCLLIAATIHTESGRGRINKPGSSPVDPFASPQFKYSVKRCIAQFPKETE
jgi:hypothetical protein